MGIIGDTPTYPVVDRAPTFATVGASSVTRVSPRARLSRAPRPRSTRTRARVPPHRDSPDPNKPSRPHARTASLAHPHRPPPRLRPAVGNFNMTDYRDWALFTATGLPVGYMSGALSGPGIRRPAMVTGGIIGGLGGLMWAMQSSAGRLMGFLENDAEVKRQR